MIPILPSLHRNLPAIHALIWFLNEILVSCFHFLVVKIWLLIFYLWQKLSVSFLESFVFHFYLCSFRTASNTSFVESFFKAIFSKHNKKPFRSASTPQQISASFLVHCLKTVLLPFYFHTTSALVEWINDSGTSND